LDAIFECLYLIIDNGNVGVALRDHCSIPVKFIFFDLKCLQSVFESIIGRFNILFGCLKNIGDANWGEINALRGINKHVKLSSFNPCSPLGLLILDLDTMNVDVLLQRLNTSLILAVLNPSMLQTTIKFFSLLL
jgi:hypothetical protein